MQELLRNAVSGWQRYTDDGKYAVLLLGILLLYWYLKRTGSDACTANRNLLWKYTVLTAVMAIFPVTGAILMKYQTRFYDYEWIWSLVPVTLVIAAGMTGFYLECYRKYWKGKLVKPALLAAAGLALLFLCGNMGKSLVQREMNAEGKETASRILEEINALSVAADHGDENRDGDLGNTESICLWAPREIMQYVRGISAEIQLLYGRNMWDQALNAYSYDTYSPELTELYEWMEQLDDRETIPEEAESMGPVYLEAALEYGVNCIVVPQGSQDITDSLKRISEKKSLQIVKQSAEGFEIYRILK
ncbi:MAG: hypothetical protein IJ324_13415 [Lachnospiraceae bacterium]|nr:hypothetical protein [Lachnospiraceae bacterium]MBQ8232122.1 hypothetical protein [Lachnospiraceae bacterium]